MTTMKMKTHCPPRSTTVSELESPLESPVAPPLQALLLER
jgi:hypothetical protein